MDSTPPTAVDLADPQALAAELQRHERRLLRMIQLRLDHRLRGRIDAADVLQEAFADVATRLPEHLADPSVPFFVWLRFLTLQQLALVHRKHLGVQARDARREVTLEPELPDASSDVLARQLAGKLTTPSQAAVRQEVRARVHAALDAMPPIDREILALRHFEQLTNSEAARVLNLSESAAANRYLRSLDRLKNVLRDLPE